MSSLKSRATMLWVLLVMGTSIVTFLYLVQGQAPATTAILAPGQFLDEAAVAESVSKSLPRAVLQNNFFWLGIEPEKAEQVRIAAAIINNLKAENKIQKVIVDLELSLKPEFLKLMGLTDMILTKENLYLLGEKLQELEKNNIGYIFISASIYTTSVLKKNPYDILTGQYRLKPVSISFAYLPTSVADEKNMLFTCRTEDQAGTAEWGCVVVNRARIVRKKLIPDLSKKWFALMDQASENSYILLLKKHD